MIGCYTSNIGDENPPTTRRHSYSISTEAAMKRQYCVNNVPLSRSHTPTAVVSMMKDNAVASSGVGLFAQSKASCLPHFHQRRHQEQNAHLM